ncbi:type VI secretion system-associated protein TagO [Pelagibacterium sp.]|uniref:type VI secretion system-associated protein TagO n=1 Tax=Pelagibacterium sp. TaxID=1967288 RepID=UPI003A959EE8
MKNLALAGLLFVGLSGATLAQDTAEQCGAIDDGAERLVCYDLLFRVDRSAEQSGPESQWTVRTDVSRIDDSTNVFMNLSSSDTFPKRFGGEGRATMLVRCSENTTTLYFTMGGHHLADLQNYGRVTYRIDDAPAQTKRFTESTDNQALGLWNGGSSIPLIKSLFGAENLLVQITPYGESAITVDFPITGFEEEIAPLREACNW